MVHKTYNKDVYSKDINYHVVLKFHKNLAALVGEGSLVIDLEVDAREEEGWQEEVVYREGSKFTLYNEKKFWAYAEAHCKGHLASVLTEDEQNEMKASASTATNVWIGATDQIDEGVWEWTDGSPRAYSKWGSGSGKKGPDSNCVQLRTLLTGQAQRLTARMKVVA